MGQARGAGDGDCPDLVRSQCARHRDAPHVEYRDLPRRRSHRVDGGGGLGRRPGQRRGHEARRRAAGPHGHPGCLPRRAFLHHRPGFGCRARASADRRHRCRHVVDQLLAAGADGQIQRVVPGARSAAAHPGSEVQFGEHPRGGQARLHPVRWGGHGRRRGRLRGQGGRGVVESAECCGRWRGRSRLRDVRGCSHARIRGRADHRS